MPYDDDRVDLTDDRHRDFMEKLTEDDDFRAELQDNPGEVLPRYGIPHDPERMPGKLDLLPKEEIKEHLGEYLEDLQQGICVAIPAPLYPKRK